MPKEPVDDNCENERKQQGDKPPNSGFPPFSSTDCFSIIEVAGEYDIEGRFSQLGKDVSPGQVIPATRTVPLAGMPVICSSDRMLFWKRSTRWLLYLQSTAEASGPAARMSHKEVTQ